MAKLDGFWTSEVIERAGTGEGIPPHFWKSNWGNMHTEKCHKMLYGHFTSTPTGKDALDKLLCKAVAEKLEYRMFNYMQCGASFLPPHLYLLQKGISLLMKKHLILSNRQGVKVAFCTTPPPTPAKLTAVERYK